MPFRSQKQRAWMYANDPARAAQWEAETPSDAQLPVYAPKQHPRRRATGPPPRATKLATKLK